MSHECDHNCGSCSSKCDNAIQKDQLHPFAEVKKVIAVVSGKDEMPKEKSRVKESIDFCIFFFLFMF